MKLIKKIIIFYFLVQIEFDLFLFYVFIIVLIMIPVFMVNTPLSFSCDAKYPWVMTFKGFSGSQFLTISFKSFNSTFIDFLFPSFLAEKKRIVLQI